MKKIIKGLVGFSLGIMVFSLPAMAVHAEEDQILNGIYVDDLSLGGMTKQEAEKALEDYADALAGKTITLIAAENHEVPVTLSELGFDWSNREIIEEAARIGQDGNVIKRYKRNIDRSKIKLIGHLLASHISEIGTFEIYHSFVRSQFPRKLTVADIYRINLCRTVLQHTVGKAACGGADIRANAAFKAYIKACHSLFKL